MQIQILKSKVHGVTITEADLNYRGSLTLDENLMDAAGMFEYEKVLLVNVANGERLETYLIKGGRGTGVCCLNGPAARKGMRGDRLIVISFGLVDVKDAGNWATPVTIFPDENNQLDI